MLDPGARAGVESRLHPGETRLARRADPVPGYLVAFVAVGLLLSVLGPALGQLRRQAGVDIGSISVLFALQALGYLGASLVVGRLYDRGHGHRLLCSGLCGASGAVLLVPWAGALAALAAVFFLIGACGAAVDVGCNTLVVWARGAEVGPTMNALHLCFGLGALASPIVVDRSIAWTGDVRLASAFTAVLMLGVAIFLGRRPAPTRTSADGPAGAAVEGAVDGVVDAVRARPRFLLVVICGFFAAYVGVELGFAGWIHTYVEELGLGGPGTAAAVTSVFWLGFTAGRLLATFVARRARPARILAVACWATPLVAGLMVIGNGGAPSVWAGSFVFGMAVAPQFPTMISFAEEHLRLHGSDTAWFVAAAGLGGLTLPWLIGQVIDASGADAMPIVILVASLATLRVWLAVRRLAAGRPTGHGGAVSR